MAESLVWNAMLNTSMFTAGCASMAASMKGAQSSAGGLSGALATIGKITFAATIAGIVAVTAAIGKATLAAGQWEKDMARIAKVTDLEKGTQAYTQMSRDLLDIMSKMPASQKDIMDVAATLGQLGVEQTGIPALTESILKMTSALEISGEAGATWIAKMANMNKEAVAQAGGIDQFATKLGSAVNALENVSVAKATDITSAMTEAAGSFYAWSLDPAEQAAFITTAISRGIDPSLMRTMLASAIGGEGLYGTGRTYGTEQVLNKKTGLYEEKKRTGLSGLDIAGEFLGVSAEEVNKRFTADSVNTVMDIVDAVKNKPGLSPGEQQAALQKIFGGYAAKEIIKLGGAQEEYARYLSISNEEMQTGQSINKEYEKSIDNMIDKGKIFANALKVLAIELGELFSPLGSSLFEGWTESIQGAIEWIRKMKDEGASIGEVFSEAAEIIKDKLVDKIKDIDWRGAFDRVSDAMIRAFTIAKDKLTSIDWNSTGTQISTLISAGLAALSEKFGPILDKIRNFIYNYDWTNIGRDVARFLADAVAAGMSLVGNAIKGFFDSNAGPSWFSAISTAFWEFLVGFKQEMLGDTTWQDVIFHPLRTAVNLATGFMSEHFPLLSNDIKLALADIMVALSTWQPEFMLAFVNAFNTVSEHVTNFVVGMISAFGALYLTLKDIASDIYDALVGMVPGSDKVDIGGYLAGTAEAAGSETSTYNIKENGKIIRTLDLTPAEAQEYASSYAKHPDRERTISTAGYTLGTGELNLANLKEMADSGRFEKVYATGLIGDWISSRQEKGRQEAATNPDYFDVGFGATDSKVAGDDLIEIGKDVSTITGTLSSPVGTVVENTLTEGSLEKGLEKTSDEFTGAVVDTGAPIAKAVEQLPDATANAFAAVLPKDYGEQYLQHYADLNTELTDAWTTTQGEIPTTIDTIQTQEYWDARFGGIRDLRASMEDQTEETEQIAINTGTLIGKMGDVFNKLGQTNSTIEDAAGTVADAATAAKAEPATGYFDPSTMGPDEFRAKAETLPMYYESIVGSTESYIARVKELAAEGRASPTQIEYAAKLEADQAQTKSVAQEMLGVVNTTVQSDPPVITPTENTDIVDQSTRNIITDINTATPILSVGADPTQAYLEVQSVLSWISNSYAEITVGTNYIGGNPTMNVNGSHAGGLDYVPYDNYLAMLHKGERVLTANENQGYSGGKTIQVIEGDTIFNVTGTNDEEIVRRIQVMMDERDRKRTREAFRT